MFPQRGVIDLLSDKINGLLTKRNRNGIEILGRPGVSHHFEAVHLACRVIEATNQAVPVVRDLVKTFDGTSVACQDFASGMTLA